jgi:TonB-linked SusC/RagA family outer membrane protein
MSQIRTLFWIVALASALNCHGQSVSRDEQDTTRNLSGLVLNGRGIPVSGVSVSIEGALSSPEITDSTGSFTLSLGSSPAWILVSPVDRYNSQRIFVDRRDTIRVYLSDPDRPSVHDPIMEPTGISLERDYSSSLERLPVQKISTTPSQTFDQVFSGRVSGMYTIGRSGMPGSGVSAWLRGVNSMNASGQPLIVIDGIPLEPSGLMGSNMDGYAYSPLSSVDPNDITSSSLHKDYSIGSIMGMRGSNGVILIETLTPSEIQTNIDFGFRTGFSSSPRQIPQLNSGQYRTLANEVLLTSGQYEEDFRLEYPGLYAVEPEGEYYLYKHHTNWQDEIFSNSLVNDVYLRVRGGDQITRYGLSVGYLNHKGVINNTGFNRFNIRFIGTFTVFKWLRMYVSSNLNNSNSDLRESARISQTSPIFSALSKTPLLSPLGYDSEGKRLKTLGDVESLGISNPSAIINELIAEQKTNRFLTSIRLEGDLTERLKVNSLFGLNYITSSEKNFIPDHGIEILNDGKVFNMSRSMKNMFFSIYNDNYVSYSALPSARDIINVKAGLSINTNRLEDDWAIASNSNENDEYRSLQSGTSYLNELGGRNEQWNRLSVYALANYSRSDKYILGASINSAFSSRTGQNQDNRSDGLYYLGDYPFGLFYSLSGAWRISGEGFMDGLPWIEDLKLRVSWGSAGNDDIGNYNSRRYYNLLLFRESTGVGPGNISDQTLRFESSYRLNPGLDLALLGNRVNLNLDYFSTTTRNMMIYKPVSTYTGFNYTATNDGSMINQGWEINSSVRIISRKNTTLDLGFNIASVKNEVLSISNDALITPFKGGAFISAVGEPLQSFYGYVYEGVFSSEAEAAEAGLVNAAGIPFGAGDARYSDIGSWDHEHNQWSSEKDGIINEYDRSIIGSPMPDLYGGVYTTLRWKRWSLDALVQFVYGNEVFNYLRFQNEKMSTLSNQSIATLDRWQYEGQQTDVPRALWDDPVGNSDFSSRWIEDGSYVRLKNLNLAYRIPDKVLFFRNLEVFITASNLVTFTNYLGFDPEFSYSFHAMEQGIDYGLMPQVRTYMIGIKVGL